MIRRQFLRQSTLATGSLLWSSSLLAAVGQPEVTKLTLLHTNDVHSRIDPFPMDGSRNQGQGGAARRKPAGEGEGEPEVKDKPKVSPTWRGFPKKSKEPDLGF